MDSLFERPGWRAVGVITGALLAGGSLTWAAVAATSGSPEAEPTSTPTPSNTPIESPPAA